MEVTKSMLVYAEPPSSTSTQFGQLLPLFAVTPTPTITSVQTLVQTIKSSHIPNNNFQADPSSDAVWERLSMCEAGGHWNEDTGNSFYGGLQFTLGTWASVGGVGKPSDASKDEQIYRAKILQSRRGWGPWPACSKKLGLE